MKKNRSGRNAGRDERTIEQIDPNGPNPQIVSVGMSSKSLNPYDTSAPTELFADPVVRVFDARMPGRPGPPLQFSMLAAPRLVRFLADETLVLTSASGQFLVSKEPFTGESVSACRRTSVTKDRVQLYCSYSVLF